MKVASVNLHGTLARNSFIIKKKKKKELAVLVDNKIHA
jgi:hypothetical protein